MIAKIDEKTVIMSCDLCRKPLAKISRAASVGQSMRRILFKETERMQGTMVTCHPSCGYRHVPPQQRVRAQACLD